MNQRQPGRSGLEVSALGFGCMGLKLAKAMGAEVTLFSRKALAGSLIGGIAETQEMLASADSTALPQTSRSSIFRTSTKPMSACSRPM